MARLLLRGLGDGPDGIGIGSQASSSLAIHLGREMKPSERIQQIGKALRWERSSKSQVQSAGDTLRIQIFAQVQELERDNHDLRQANQECETECDELRKERDRLADALNRILVARDSIEALQITRKALASLNQSHAPSSEQKDSDRAKK